MAARGLRAADRSWNLPIRSLLSMSGVFAALAVWQALTMFFRLPAYVLPSPEALAQGLASNWSLLSTSLASLLEQASLGFLVGNTTGIALAIAIDRMDSLRTVLVPFALLIRSVPIVAVTPLITLVAGFGVITAVIVVALISFFPAFVNIAVGLRSDSDMADMLKSLGANRWHSLLKMQLPNSIPYLLSAAKISAPAAVLGAVIAEYLSTNSGLGYIIQNADSNYHYDLVWEASSLATAVVLASVAVTSFAERRLGRWSGSE